MFNAHTYANLVRSYTGSFLRFFIQLFMRC